MSTERYNYVPQDRVSVFNWIPPQFWDSILAGTCTQNLQPYVQDACNQCGGRTLIFEGDIGLSSPVVITNGALRIGGRGRVFALANLDTNNDGRGALFYAPDVRFSISEVNLDLAGYQGNGIFIDRTGSFTFEDFVISNIPAGYAGVRGGSLLYAKVLGVTCSGQGRSFDLQKGWELVSTTSYYGSNEGLFQACQSYCAEGLRISGDNELHVVNQESAINQPALRNEVRGPNAAAFVLGEEIGAANAANFVLISCYHELSAGGTATVLASIVNVASTAVIHIVSGTYFGSSKNLVNSTFYVGSLASLSIDGNPNIKRWYNIFNGSYSGNANQSTLTWFLGAAIDDGFTNLFVPGAGVQPDEVVRNVGGWGDCFYSATGGIQFGPAIAGIIISVPPNSDSADQNHKINLAQANRFLLTPPSPLVPTLITSAFLANVKAGRRFTLETNSVSYTLENATFHLISGVDTLMTPGMILDFAVDWQGVIREVGHT